MVCGRRIFSVCIIEVDWWILSILMGIMFSVDAVQYFGAAFIFAGMIGMLEKIWPKAESRYNR